MRIDREKIKAAFPGYAWAYAESLDAVRIGKWNGEKLEFYDQLDESLLQTLRVFSNERELKFSGDKCRDTDIYKGENFIRDLELTDSKYFMYGEQASADRDYTKLCEDRGGSFYFPARLSFPEDKVGLKLGIRNFVRYNDVPVCPLNKEYDFGLNHSGAGAFEVVDYAYTGFFYAYNDEKAVEL
ncbi:hypothetical protein AGMMS50276_00300 [Synergistales bacterium]|nr:hypothetical protein AGMMS50276_00300 [Synergistales bacterium]